MIPRPQATKPIERRSTELPSLKNVMLSSDEAQTDPNHLEKALFRNRYLDGHFSPRLVSDRERGANIKLLKLNVPKQCQNHKEKVSDLWPFFDKPVNRMHHTDRKEFYRLANLVKIKDQLPLFLVKELSHYRPTQAEEAELKQRPRRKSPR